MVGEQVDELNWIQSLSSLVIEGENTPIGDENSIIFYKYIYKLCIIL